MISSSTPLLSLLFSFSQILFICAAPNFIKQNLFNPLNFQQQQQQQPQQPLVPFNFPFNPEYKHHQQPKQQSIENRDAFEYSVPPKDCHSLALDVAPTLKFVDEEPPRLIVNKNVTPGFGCQRIFECKVLSSPPEANTYWFRNGKIIKITTLRDLTLNTVPTDTKEALKRNEIQENDEFMLYSPMIGLSQMTHRICLDSYILPLKENEFKCRIQSVCEPENFLESKPVVVKSSESQQPFRLNLSNNNKRDLENDKSLFRGANLILRRNNAMVQKKKVDSAPLITTITSTRMELAGRVVQIACHASGYPKPRIEWSILDDDNVHISYSIKSAPFIWEMPNGDLLIDTAKTDVASVTLKCEATNEFGSDLDTSTLILLKEE